MNGDRDADFREKLNKDLTGSQKGTGTDSEIDELAKKDKNQQIEDDVKDGEPDADAKKAAMAQAKTIVTAGDVAGKHPTEIMSALWSLTIFKGVRGFSFAPINATDFEIYMHGSKKRIKPKDGKYDIKKEPEKSGSQNVSQAKRSINEQFTKGKSASVTVSSKSDAEILLRDLTSGSEHKGGYMDTTDLGSFSPQADASDYLPRESTKKAGTYHWDDFDPNAKIGDHAKQGAHLQIHTFEGKVIRIFF